MKGKGFKYFANSFSSELVSLHFVMDSPDDSIYYHLDKSFAYDSIWFCYYLMESNRRPIEVPQLYEYLGKIDYFVLQLPEEKKNYYLTRCKNVCGECRKKENNEAKHTRYDTILTQMGKWDQYARKDSIINWSIQDSLDLANRIKLDSLFELYNFPSANQVSKKNQKVVWKILQHSTDCEWNKKWIIRFLDAFKDKQIAGGFLGQTIERFYEPASGFCKNDSKQFIALLKSKYPSEYGKIFGYNTY